MKCQGQLRRGKFIFIRRRESCSGVLWIMLTPCRWKVGFCRFICRVITARRGCNRSHIRCSIFQLSICIFSCFCHVWGSWRWKLWYLWVRLWVKILKMRMRQLCFCLRWGREAWYFSCCRLFYGNFMIYGRSSCRVTPWIIFYPGIFLWWWFRWSSYRNLGQVPGAIWCCWSQQIFSSLVFSRGLKIFVFGIDFIWVARWCSQELTLLPHIFW